VGNHSPVQRDRTRRPPVAITQRELGDVERRSRLPHRGEQLPHLDLLPARPTRRHPLGQAIPYSFDGLRKGQACPQMLLWRPARLRVNDPIGCQVCHELSSDPAQIRRCLHHRDGLIESLQVWHQRARVGRFGEPPTKIIGTLGGQFVPDVGSQFDDRLRPQPTIEMIMERDLRECLQRFQVKAHDRPVPSRLARRLGAAAYSAAGCLMGCRPDTRRRRAPRAADDSGHTASAPTRLNPRRQVRRADHLHWRVAPTPTHILRTGPTRTRRSRRCSRPPPARRQQARPHRLDSQSKARTHAGSRL
jgi:hypothetical protein